MGIDEDEDVGGGFDSVIASGKGKSAGKQLKLCKSKVLVAIIKCKKYYLLKKTASIKLF